jgi:hypothetical protein
MGACGQCIDPLYRCVDSVVALCPFAAEKEPQDIVDRKKNTKCCEDELRHDLHSFCSTNVAVDGCFPFELDATSKNEYSLDGSSVNRTFSSTYAESSSFITFVLFLRLLMSSHDEPPRISEREKHMLQRSSIALFRRGNDSGWACSFAAIVALDGTHDQPASNVDKVKAESMQAVQAPRRSMQDQQYVRVVPHVLFWLLLCWISSSSALPLSSCHVNDRLQDQHGVGLGRQS